MAQLLFFGKLADIAGVRQRELSLPAGVETVAALRDHIAAGDAELGVALMAPSVKFVVNEAIVSDDARISDADEVAFLPPVSGG